MKNELFSSFSKQIRVTDSSPKVIINPNETPSFCSPKSKVYFKAEVSLNYLYKKTFEVDSFKEYSMLEEHVLEIFHPLVLPIIYRYFRKGNGIDLDRSIKMSHFHLFLVLMWRQRLYDHNMPINPKFDPNEELIQQIVCFINDLSSSIEKSGNYSGQNNLKLVYIPFLGCTLQELPKYLIQKIDNHPCLDSRWKSKMLGMKIVSEERFDPKKGLFVEWVLNRFSLRIRDFISREEHVVRRSQKTETRRRFKSEGEKKVFIGREITKKFHSQETDEWGYYRVDGFQSQNAIMCCLSDNFGPVLDSRLELDSILSFIKREDYAFLSPLIKFRVNDSKGLAQYWRVTPAAVSKRMKKIRNFIRKKLDDNFIFNTK